MKQGPGKIPSLPVDLSMLGRLRELLDANTRSPSEYSLPNLYLYRRRHAYRLVDGSEPYMTGMTYDGARHVLPLGLVTQDHLSSWTNDFDCIYPLEESEARTITEGTNCTVNQCDDDTDYTYDTISLAVLKGAKDKRAQANRFAARDPAVHPFEPDAAREVLECWVEQAARGPDYADAHECAEAIKLHSELNLDGPIIYVDGKPVAFLLAGMPRNGERIVHFAKGRRDIMGAYPWMFAHFAEHCGVDRLNFEQDMGNPGLGRAKRALNPSARRKKFRVERLK